jgi:hypothetical protein
VVISSENLENIRVAVRVRPLLNNEQGCEESLAVLDVRQLFTNYKLSLGYNSNCKKGISSI